MDDSYFDSSQPFADLLRSYYRLIQYQAKIDQLNDIDDDDSLRALSKLVDSSFDIINNQKINIENIMGHLDLLIEERKSEVGLNSAKIPTKEELKIKFDEFINLQLPLATSPYPDLCGAIQWPIDKILPNDTFACAPTDDDQYILTIILGFDPETYTYKVTDADPQDDVVVFDVPADKILPLPTSLPVRRNKLVTIPIKGRVLALWKDEIGWTSVFYSATVISQPNNSPNYLLKFDGDPPISAPIPERFVIRANV